MEKFIAKKRLGFLGIAGAGMFLALAARAGSPDSGPTSLSEVRPSLGDLMTIAQLRHFKLGYSHRVGNWQLAGYELQKLEETFTKIARLYPTAAAVAQSGLIDEKTKPALADLRSAIAEQDTPRFKAAYQTVTTACNQCHDAAKVGFITIRIPTKSPFSNQVFDPNEGSGETDTDR